MDLASPSSGDQQQFAGRYQLIRKIGAGGQSEVFEAHDPLLDRRIALKILRLDQSANLQAMQQRFVNEYKVIGRLKHANIVQVFAFDWNDGQAFIAMELLEGKTLESVLTEQSALNQEQFKKTFLPVLDAFEFAHQLRLIHRDIKPENIMIMGDFEEIKVLDFGLASILAPGKSELTQTTITGSPYYMSPEQCAGKALDQRSDIYSLACVMYKALVGQPPFAGKTAAETMYMHLHAQAKLNPEITVSNKIPQKLYAVVLEALSKDPVKRPKSMSLFRQQVDSALNSGNFLSSSGLNSKIKLASVCGLFFLLISVFAGAFAFLSGGPVKNKQARAGLEKRSKRFLPIARILNEASIIQNSGKPEEALVFLQDFESKMNPASVDRYGLYSIYYRIGHDAREIARTKQNSESMKYLQLAMRYYDKADPYCDSPTRRVELMGWRLELLELFSKNSEAEDELKRVKSILVKKSSEPDLMSLACWHYFNARHLKQTGKVKEAVVEYRKSLQLFDSLPFRRTEQGACQSTVDLCEFAGSKFFSSAEAKKEMEKTLADLNGNPYKSQTFVQGLRIVANYLLLNKQPETGTKLLAFADEYERDQARSNPLHTFSEEVVNKLSR